MKRFSEQLQNKAAHITLTATERTDLRERVVSYMEYHPLPKQVVTTTKSGSVKMPVGTEYLLVKINAWKTWRFAGAFLGIMFLATTYLAERTVPGDTLYAVKVSFNEEVRSTLAFSPYEKVVWETERLNRRIAEARVLASTGKLTEEMEEQVASAVREHSDNAKREIEVLKQTDKEEAVLASIQLATALDVQGTTLVSDSATQTVAGQSTSLIATALAESESEVNTLRAEEEVLPSYERLTAHIEQETTRAYELLKSVHDLATAEEQADIKRRLEDIDRSIIETKQSFESDNKAARLGLIDVLARTQKLIVFMTNIDVRQVVTVEEIVPVTLTLAERQKIVEKQSLDTVALANRINLFIASTTTIAPEVIEKITPALAVSIKDAERVLAEVQIGGAEIAPLEQVAGSAYAVVFDTAQLLGVSTVLETTNESSLPVETPTTTEVATSTATTSDEIVPGTETVSDTVASTTETEVVEEEGEVLVVDSLPE
jgi:Domain of unknown function (DUF5667)